MMYIIEIPEGTRFADMPVELQNAISANNGAYADVRLVGTEPLAGKELRLIQCDLDDETLVLLTNNDLFDDDGNQYGFDLCWSIVAQEGVPVVQSTLLPYFADVPVFDENGDIAGYETVTDLTGKLQTWAGKEWQY